MNSLATQWLQHARAAMDRIEQTQTDNIRRASEVMADSIAADRWVHTFGCGHATIPVEEMYPRIGGFVGFHPMVELPLTFFTRITGEMGVHQFLFLERAEGYGVEIMKGYQFDPRDTMWIFSHSGINNVNIDVALEAKKRGMKVIAYGSAAAAQGKETRHSCGKTIFDLADIVVDSCAPAEDASVPLVHHQDKVGPVSTMAFVTCVWMTICTVAEILADRGVKLHIHPSHNVPGDTTAHQRLDAALAEYKRRAAGVSRARVAAYHHGQIADAGGAISDPNSEKRPRREDSCIAGRRVANLSALWTPPGGRSAFLSTLSERTLLMCMCHPELNRRDVMRGAVGLGAAALAGGMELFRATPALGAVPAPTIHGTSAWGARAPSSAVTVLNYRPTYIVIHHTATSNGTATTQAAAFSLARSIQNYHMDNNGWIDTGQQFTVSRGGHAMEGRHRSLERLNLGNSFVRGAHVGAGNVNSEAIGIENEGLYTSVSPPAALYDKLVDLCAYICDKYNIPSSQIFGHRDFMATACPGNILYGMLPGLRSDVAAALAGGSYSTVVDNATAGRFTASGNWGTSSFSSQRYGADYRFANPTPASDAAWFKVNIPTTRSYLVDAWHPDDPGYNNLTPYVIVTSSGNQTVQLNQQTGGAQWRNLGTFNLSAGDYNVVGVSRWTSGTGYVIADAIRVRTP